MTHYMLCLVLFCVGFYAVTKRNLIKMVIGISIMESAINLFLILVGYRSGGVLPLFSGEEAPSAGAAMVDPLPQAFVTVSIVVGLATLIVLSAVAMRLYEKYGTFDITEIRRLKG